MSTVMHKDTSNLPTKDNCIKNVRYVPFRFGFSLSLSLLKFKHWWFHVRSHIEFQMSSYKSWTVALNAVAFSNAPEKEMVGVKFSFPPFIMKISHQIPYQISDQVSYLSWAANLTAGSHSPHGNLKCTWERECWCKNQLSSIYNGEWRWHLCKRWRRSAWWGHQPIRPCVGKE